MSNAAEQIKTAVVFRAAIKQTQNAITLGSNGEGALVTFELPESEMGQITELVKLRRAELIVTVVRAGQHLHPAEPEKAATAQPEANLTPSTQRKRANKEPKPDKGAHGQFWLQMLKPGAKVHLTPGIREALAERIDPDDVWTVNVVKRAYKAIFGLDYATSLSTVSPEQVRAVFSTEQVDIITAQCERKAAAHSIRCAGYRGPGKPWDESACNCGAVPH